MRLALTVSFSALVLLFLGLVGTASADPVNSPNVSIGGAIVCGDTTYTVVSPNHAPVGQILTANGSNSTSVQIMIVDKAGARFPQRLLTLCTLNPPDEPPFQAYLLITPVR
jgi:hypothetical protein